MIKASVEVSRGERSKGTVNWGTSNLMVVGALLSGVSAGNFSYMFRIYEKSPYSPQ